MTRPDILVLEGADETVALGTGTALNALVTPYREAGVNFTPQLKAVEDGGGLALAIPALRMPGTRLSDLAHAHTTVRRSTATLSCWRFRKVKGAEGPEQGWGWHRFGRENPPGRTPLYSLSQGGGFGWLLGSHHQLMRALHLNFLGGRDVLQIVDSRTDRVSAVALADDDLCALEGDLWRDGHPVVSWTWSP